VEQLPFSCSTVNSDSVCVATVSPCTWAASQTVFIQAEILSSYTADWTVDSAELCTFLTSHLKVIRVFLSSVVRSAFHRCRISISMLKDDGLCSDEQRYCAGCRHCYPRLRLRQCPPHLQDRRARRRCRHLGLALTSSKWSIFSAYIILRVDCRQLEGQPQHLHRPGRPSSLF